MSFVMAAPGRRRSSDLWLATAAYVVVVSLPLFVVQVGSSSPRRDFWVEFGVALGFVGLAMMGLQSVLTARYPRLSGALGQDVLLQFHRQAGIVALCFVLAHPLVLLVATPGARDFLDPSVDLLRALFLWLALLGLPVLVATALWRERLRLPYQWSRLGHGIVALGVVFIGLVHIFRVQYYLGDVWKQVLWGAIGVGSMGSVIYVRAVKPLLVRRHPYRLTAVEPLAPQVWRLRLEPDGERALDFRAGQFAFVTFDANPYALEQHPFSLASSAEAHDHLELAVKELGDFTDRIGDLRVGQRAFVDGPYGSMQLEQDPPGGLLLVAGGIGITPAISMVRTLADRAYRGPVVLIHGARQVDELVYADELAALAHRLDLAVVPVVSDPPEWWAGARGRVSTELVTEHLPADAVGAGWRAVLCGPPAMMEVAERALLEAGLPLAAIDAERFDIGASRSVGRRGTLIRRAVLGLGAAMVVASALFAI